MSIPLRLRDKLSLDPDMRHCIICGQPPQWHHVISSMGAKQVSERWSIAPLCYDHHVKNITTEIKRKALWWCLNRATDEELSKYPKHRLIEEKNRLKKIYGN